MCIRDRYNDVRLVGAPPSAIGKYGGDTNIRLKVTEVSGSGGILNFVQTDGFDNDPLRTVGSHEVTADGGTASTSAVFNVLIGDGGSFANDTVWEAGNFDWFGKITPQAADIDGGVQWEGYFIPTITGRVVFSTNSTGYFTVDFNKEGYEEDNDKNTIIACIPEHMIIYAYLQPV